jgi:hypothetical protein
MPRKSTLNHVAKATALALTLLISNQAALAAPPAASSTASTGSSGSTAGAAAATGSTSGSSTSAASGPSSAAGTSGYQNSTALFQVSHPTLFVLVYGPDPVTTNVIAYEVSLKLGNPVDCIERKLKPGCSPRVAYMMNRARDGARLWVLPEPAWTLADYATQCENDPDHTAGALILYDIENDAGTYSYVIFQSQYSHLYSKAILVNCHRWPPATITSISKSLVKNYPATTASSSTPADTTTTTVCYPTENQPCTQKNTQAKTVANATSGTTVTTSSPPPEVDTRTKSITFVPRMTIVWQNSDNLDGAGAQGAVPFLGLAALASYLAQRYTKSTVSTTSQTTPSTLTIGKTVTDSVATTSNTSDLPLSLAIIASSVGGLNSVSLGGQNPTRAEKSAAATLATRLVNLITYDCGDPEAGDPPPYNDKPKPDPHNPTPECKDINDIFDLGTFREVTNRQRVNPPVCNTDRLVELQACEDIGPG